MKDKNDKTTEDIEQQQAVRVMIFDHWIAFGRWPTFTELSKFACGVVPAYKLKKWFSTSNQTCAIKYVDGKTVYFTTKKGLRRVMPKTVWYLDDRWMWATVKLLHQAVPGHVRIEYHR